MVFGAIIGGLSLIESHRQQRKARKEQKRANLLQQRIADNEAARERRNQVRQARILRAGIVNRAAQTGGTGSSSETSAVGGVASNLSLNLAESFVTQNISGQITAALGRSAAASGRASLFKDISNFSTQHGDSLSGLFK